MSAKMQKMVGKFQKKFEQLWEKSRNSFIQKCKQKKIAANIEKLTERNPGILEKKIRKWWEKLKN